MRHEAQTPLLEGYVRAAWQTQLAAARQTPGLLPILLRHRATLLPRFAATYTALRALPRQVRWALHRSGRASLASVALWLVLGQGPVDAATIAVRGACTLVHAIRAANTDRASGGCPAGQGADTIVLPANSTHTHTQVDNDTYGPTGLPVISSPITIMGRGSRIQRASHAPEFRILAVNSTGDLTLQETTVSGGMTGVEAFAESGGGVANFDGTFTLLNSTIMGNTAGLFGGGVYNRGTLTLQSSSITGNVLARSKYAGGGGGGVPRPQGLGCDVGAVEGGAPTLMNDLVTLVPLPATFQTSANTSGCPSGFVGTFRFSAQLTAPAPSPPLMALVIEVATLSNGNLVQNALGGSQGVGARVPVPLQGSLADGLLNANEAVEVPLVICLRQKTPFQFFVDVLGVEQE